MSKIIHRPLVERTSETAAKTIARPTAILTGGVSAFVGSIIVLYYAKRSGFSVGLSLFIILFAGGYLIGLLIELIIKTYSKLSRN